jgi:hypothetical protein
MTTSLSWATHSSAPRRPFVKRVFQRPARAFDLLISNNIVSVQELAANVQLRIRDVEDVCGFRPDDLANLDPPPIRLSANVNPINTWAKSAMTGNWVFPIKKSR